MTRSSAILPEGAFRFRSKCSSSQWRNEIARFVAIDDDRDFLLLMQIALEASGHQVESFTDPEAALRRIQEAPPDCILTDLMMPEIDGMELCRRVRKANPDVMLVVLTGKLYEADRRLAMQAGANGYILKSRCDPNVIAQEVLEFINETVTLTFWGSRGTVPVPGPRTVRYGGNTACVSLEFPDDHVLIFDAGTGIRNLGAQLTTRKKKIRGTFLNSHPHWDHLNFLPFFTPLFVPGNDFTIAGPAQGSVTMEQLLANQMDGLHFPITPREFGAHIEYRDLEVGEYTFGPAKVQTFLLCHPGYCLGYRVEYGEHAVCYVTDNELFLEDSDHYSPNYVKSLAEFIKQARILITDCTYFDDEYPSKVGWGHACVSEVAKLAHQGQVEELYLFHHEPGQDDDAIDRKLEAVREVLASLGSSVRTRVAIEGAPIVL